MVTRIAPSFAHAHCSMAYALSEKLSVGQWVPQGSAYLVFPIITPTRSPFFTPSPTSPRASALMWVSNSLKSQAKYPSTPLLLGSGPPCALGRSCKHIRARRSGLRDNISAEKYLGRVRLSRGGWRAPSTAESVMPRAKYPSPRCRGRCLGRVAVVKSMFHLFFIGKRFILDRLNTEKVLDSARE